MKRLLALLLCLCLCASLIPAAFAEDADDIVIVDTEEDAEELPEEELVPLIDLEPLEIDRGALSGEPAAEIQSTVASGKCGDDLEWSLYDNGDLYIYGDGDMYDYSTLNHAPWYPYRAEIKLLHFGFTVKSIGAYAFLDCANMDLDKLNGFYYVEKIGAFAFWGCRSLEHLYMSDYVGKIGSYAFRGCTGLKHATIGGCPSIGSGIFYGCDAMEAVSFLYYRAPSFSGDSFGGTPEGFHVFYPYAISSNWPSSVVGNAYGGDDVTWQFGVCGWCGDDADWYLDTETNRLHIYGSGPTWPRPSFNGLMNRVSSVYISPGITTLGEYFFDDLGLVSEVILPDTLEEIGERCFWSCPITALTIPASVTKIGEYALAGYNGLELRFLGHPPEIDDEAFFNTTATVTYYPLPDWTAEARQNYGGTLTWVCDNKIGTNVTWALSSDGTLTLSGSGATREFAMNEYPGFYYVGNECKSLTVGSGITALSSDLFYGVRGLESAVIPASVTEIGSYAFGGCYYLATISFAGNAPSFGTNCFYDVTDLTVWYPGNNTSWTSEVTARKYGADKITWVAGTKPVIETQPSNVTKAPGETATFKVTAAGGGLSYQWQYYSSSDKAWYNLTNSAYSGAKTPTMSVQATAARSGFVFRCAVTNAVGTTYTNSVTLTVINKPTITAQPVSVTKYAGETATFKVTASGATSYQWQYYSETYKAWYNITNSAYSGAKTAAMSVQATTARNGYIFRCAVTNAAGTVYTNSVKLTVSVKPVITVQPTNAAKAPGETATFKVTASGATSYQWQYYSSSDNAWYNITNSAYSGAKTNTMSVEATTARNGFIFRCAVTNANGTVYTNSVKLTVAAKPTITAQPQSVTKYAGETATFKVTASGAASYQWQYYSETYKAWYNITNSAYSGAKTATMSVQATTARNGYLFRCAVTNAGGTVYTNSVKLTVSVKPVITSQPVSVTKTAGQTASFKVTASGAASYQWQYYSASDNAWYNITNSAYSGAKTATMSVQATTARNGFIFRCAITNANGTVYTNSVKLTVTG